MHTTRGTVGTSFNHLPMAHAVPFAGRVVDRHEIAERAAQFTNTSVGKRFFGPGWVNEDGGTMAEEARIQVYRSRSASKMIFDELSTAPQGNRPQWFEFEKECARMLAGKGMRVIHQAASRDGDGGVDLYAVDPHGKSWIVQCKCWSAHRPVGPGVIRELEGAIRLADKGTSSQNRGMIITTSTFTAGASADAISLGFELIDGEKFSNLT